MTAEKDIRHLSPWFVGGIAGGTALAAALSGRFPALHVAAGAAFVLLLAAVAAITLTRSRGLLPYLLLLAGAGVFCALSSYVSVSFHLASSQLSSPVAALQRLIDSIPFSSPGTAPLLKALTTGDRHHLSPDVLSAFRGSGASHILALSGLHLGILYGLMRLAVSPLGKSPLARLAAFLLCVPAAGFYTLATGASPSIVRAFLFILLAEGARLGGRRPAPLNLYCTAITLQLIISPQVISSLGFQLSYLAMAGIFLVFPRLEAFWPEEDRKSIPGRIWSAAALSISCQLLTAPLVWLRFRTFPIYFLLTNLIAMPLTTLLMTVAAATLILAGAGICPGILIHACDALCTALTGILGLIAGM